MLDRDQMEMTSRRRACDREGPRPGVQAGDGASSVLRSRRRRRAPGSVAAVFCLFFLASALGLGIRAAWSEGQALPAGVGVALTRIVEIVDPDVVILGAGRLDGLTDSARVMLLREGDPIVHPLTGQVLGTPQEPVGTVRVFQLQDHSARARLESVYSTPAVDDLAEFETSVPRGHPVQAEAGVAEVRPGFEARVKELEVSVQQYEKSSERLKNYPTFARRVWDQLTDVRTRLAALDARLVELEEQQIVDRLRLSSVVSGEYNEFDDVGRRELREFTVKYSPDTQIRLSAKGKTLFITVVNDSLRLEESVESAGEQAGRVEEEESEAGFLSLLGLYDDDGEGVASSGEEPWYKTRWHLAGGAAILVLGLAIGVALVIRKRYSDVMEGMEEFDDDYLEDEDDDDDYEK